MQIVFSSRRALVALAAGLVVLASCLPRILLASGRLPDVLRPFVWSDPLLTYMRGLSGHRLPYVDTEFEYPPLVAILSGAFSLIASNAAFYVVCWSVLLALAAAITAYVLTAAATERRSLAYWVLTPQLLLLAGINFDALPVMFLTLAAVAQRSGRVVATSVALGLGTAAKLFPLASLPIAIARADRKLYAAASFALTIAVLYLPTVLLPRSSAAGLAFYAVGIPANLDSVWGIATLILKGLSLPEASATVVVVTTVGLVATYLLHVLPRARRAADPVVPFALATVVLMFWSRLYSPQYSLWLLPFFVLLPLGARRFAALTIADVGVFGTIYPLTLVPRASDDPTSVFLLGALAGFVFLRQVVLVSCWRRLAASDRYETDLSHKHGLSIPNNQ